MTGCSLMPSQTGFDGNADTVHIQNAHWSGEVWAFVAGAGAAGIGIGWIFIRRPKIIRKYKVE